MKDMKIDLNLTKLNCLKKAAILFFFIFLVFLSANQNDVFAQVSPTPTTAPASDFNILPEFDLPGITCGIPDSAYSKCCRLPNINFNFKTGVGALDDLILGPLSGFLNLFTKEVPRRIQELFNNFGQFQPCINNAYPVGDINSRDCFCRSSKPTFAAAVSLCKMISNTKERAECENCFDIGKKASKDIGVWTAFGCVYSDLGKFISEKLLGWGVGLAGVVALLCIIYAAFTLQTSAGNPEQIKKAQELLTSCIMGLMLIVFSVFILRLIGVNILMIPGLK